MKYIEQVLDAATPEGMRAEIFRLRHYDPIVRQTMDMADYAGMNAEDRYTVLAYHALRARSSAQEQLTEIVRISVSPPMSLRPDTRK